MSGSEYGSDFEALLPSSDEEAAPAPAPAPEVEAPEGGAPTPAPEGEAPEGGGSPGGACQQAPELSLVTSCAEVRGMFHALDSDGSGSLCRRVAFLSGSCSQRPCWQRALP